MSKDDKASSYLNPLFLASTLQDSFFAAVSTRLSQVFPHATFALPVPPPYIGCMLNVRIVFGLVIRFHSLLLDLLDS